MKPSWQGWIWGLVLLGTAQQPAWALFGDDEARKAIVELRAKVEENKQTQDAAIKQLNTASQEDLQSTRRLLTGLAGQMDQMRQEISRLRGQVEQLTQQNDQLNKALVASQTQFDTRLKQIDQRLQQNEPSQVTIEGVTFTALPDQRRDYDAAVEWLPKADFAAATAAFAQFLRKYPESGYTPAALYWLGNAQFAQRNFKGAMDAHQRLVTQFPDHPRQPEAMLAVASAQSELKDNKNAKKMLEQLIQRHPQSEAAVAAKERLATLK